MEGSYNLRNPAVKRLMREAEELRNPTEEYCAQPLEGNLFEWHFTVRGPPNTDFDGGFYHGRVTLPPEYPMKPPSIILLTPNGRFETNKKICLSISGHHPESWQPSWSIRTALLAIIGFMPTHANGAIGALDYTPEERRDLARKSRAWKCADCGNINNLLKSEVSGAQDAKIVPGSAKQTSNMVHPEGSVVETIPSGPNFQQKAEEELTPNVTYVQGQFSVTSREDSVGITTSTTTTLAAITEAELNPASEQGQSTTMTLPRLRLPHSGAQTDQPSIRSQHSAQRSPSAFPSAATSTTFIGIITFLIIFLLLRRLSSYIDCF